MERAFASLSSDRAARRAAHLLGIFGALLLSAASAMAADTKDSLAQLRAYLPTIRHKALLDIERDHAAKFKRQLGLFEVYLEGGLVTQADKAEIEDALLQSLRRVLQRDREYRDSRDEFALRDHLPAERLRKMEDASLTPLTKQFQGFEDLSHDGEQVAYEVLSSGGDKDVLKVRAVLVQNLTASALVKSTDLPKRFRKCWDQFKDADIDKLTQIVTEKRQELGKLRRHQRELEGAKQKLTEAEYQRLDDLRFDIDVCELSRTLHVYEKQPWVTLPEGIRVMERNDRFRRVARYFRFVLDWAVVERLDRLAHSWPKLAPVRLQEGDLLTADSEKAEQAAASLVKTPEAKLSVKRKVRRLRELAEGYQKYLPRSFDLGFLRREILFDKLRWPSTRPSDGPEEPGLVGPVAQRPKIEPIVAVDTIRAEALYARAKRQLLLTWIDYEAIRLDLYHELGISPP